VDVFKALRALYEERQKLDQVIEALEEIQKTAEAAAQLRQERRGRRSMDQEARRRVSERMRSYWARRKEQEPASERTPVSSRN
jgi:hypothetical protein